MWIVHMKKSYTDIKFKFNVLSDATTFLNTAVLNSEDDGTVKISVYYERKEEKNND